MLNETTNTPASELLTDTKAMLYTQAETQYTVLSTTKNAACANCRWLRNSRYDSSTTECTIVESYPEPILITGWCNKHDPRVPYKPEPLAVTIIEGERAMGDMKPADDDEEMMDDEDAPDGKKKPTKKKKPPFKSYLATEVKSIVDTVVGLFRGGDTEMFTRQTGFKDLDNGHWLAWWTNNFEDREKELFTEKAIDDYIALVESKAMPMPELWFWHVGASKHGQAKQVARLGHFAVAMGDYDDTPTAKAFRSYYRKSNDLELSHGYLYPEELHQDGAYHAFYTFEISVLPKGKAANPYTSFMEVKEMELSQEKKAALTEILGGEDKLNQLLAAAESRGKALEALGEKYKSVTPPTEDKGLADKVKALETAQTGFATKQDIETLTTGIKALTEFLQDAFGNLKVASNDKSTEIDPASDPQNTQMAAWLQQQGDSGGKGQTGAKSILDYMFKPSNGQGD